MYTPHDLRRTVLTEAYYNACNKIMTINNGTKNNKVIVNI